MDEIVNCKFSKLNLLCSEMFSALKLKVKWTKGWVVERAHRDNIILDRGEEKTKTSGGLGGGGSENIL